MYANIFFSLEPLEIKKGKRKTTVKMLSQEDFTADHRFSIDMSALK